MPFNLGTAVGYLDLDTSKFSSGFKSALSDLKIFSSSTASATDKFAALGSAMTSVGSTLTRTITVPLLGIGTTAVTVAAGFESAMSRVAAISGATGSDLEALSAKAREMGATTQFSASEAADALSYMAMAGWKTEDMLDGISGVMYLAAASGEDLATTSDIVTDALTAFGLTAADSAHFANILAAASSNANTNVAMMGETFKYAAPIAGALGFSVEDTAEAIGLMANAGIKGSQAGTTLRTMMTSLSGEVKIVGKNIGEVTIATTNADGSMRELNDILADCRIAFQGLSESEKAAAAETLVGKNAMSGFLALMNAAPEDIDKLRTAIEDSEGAAESMAGTMQDNLGGQLKILKSSLEELAISVGNMLLPLVKDIISGIQGVINWMNNLSDSQKKSIVRIAEIAAAIGPVLLLVGKLLTGIPKLISTWKALSASLGAIKGLMAALTTAGFAPIIATIGAVVAAVIALKLAWNSNFGGIREKTAEMLSAIKGIFESLVSSLKAVLEFITGLWDSNWLGIQDMFTNTWQAIEHVFSNVLDILVNVFQAFQNIFTGNWSGAWDNVKNIFKLLMDSVKTLLETNLKNLVLIIVNIGAALKGAATKAFDRIKEGFASSWDKIKTWINTVKEDPVSALKSIGSSMWDVGYRIIQSFKDGLSAAWNTIVSWANGAVGWLRGIFSVNIDTAASPSVSGSFASGLDYIPRTMNVRVHEGERILTKEQNQGYSMQREQSPEIIHLVVQSVLDKKVIGETSYEYIRNKNRSMGG